MGRKSIMNKLKEKTKIIEQIEKKIRLCIENYETPEAIVLNKSTLIKLKEELGNILNLADSLIRISTYRGLKIIIDNNLNNNIIFIKVKRYNYGKQQNSWCFSSP